MILKNKVRHYIFYNCLSNFICGVETTMSTHCMFKASTVVDCNNIDTYSIIYNITMKDFFGQMFLIPAFPFITKVSKYGDKNPLKFLGLNIILFEISTLIEHCTPIFSQSSFIFAASIANIGKTISLTGYSSFNVNVINKLCNKDNVMELNSKISTLSTISYAFGTVAGLGIVKMIPCFETRLMMLPLFGVFRYYITIKSVKGII